MWLINQVKCNTQQFTDAFLYQWMKSLPDMIKQKGEGQS